MVVFDLDDTLYKERDYAESGRRAVLQLLRQSMPEATMAEVEQIEWTPEMLQAYRSHIPDIALDSATEATLQALRDAGIKMGIITDGRSLSQRNKFRSLGLSRFVDPDTSLIISEEIGADKATPAPFEALMASYPGEKEWVYVGDNPQKDFRWPNALGWATVMLLDTLGCNIHKQDLPPDPSFWPQKTIKNIECLLQNI